ncbi:hypothetical protein MRX96_021608 [Rhipicephalus microplus]
MALAIKKVLISDAVDASCVKILENHGVQVTLKSDHTKPELLEAIKGYDGLIVRSATKVTSDVIKAGPVAQGYWTRRHGRRQHRLRCCNLGREFLSSMPQAEIPSVLPN